MVEAGSLPSPETRKLNTKIIQFFLETNGFSYPCPGNNHRLHELFQLALEDMPNSLLGNFATTEDTSRPPMIGYTELFPEEYRYLPDEGLLLVTQKPNSFVRFTKTEGAVFEKVCQHFSVEVPKLDLVQHVWQLSDPTLFPALRTHFVRIRRKVEGLGDFGENTLLLKTQRDRGCKLTTQRLLMNPGLIDINNVSKQARL
jgi:hypothetical protein